MSSTRSKHTKAIALYKRGPLTILTNTYIENITNGDHLVPDTSLASDPNQSHHGSISCNKHPKRRATFLCIAKECAQPLFCDSCSFTHSKICFSKEYFDIERLLDSNPQREASKELKTHKMLPQLSKSIDQQLRKLLAGFAQSFEQIRNILFEVDEKCSTERVLTVLREWNEILILKYKGLSIYHTFSCKVIKVVIINGIRRRS